MKNRKKSFYFILLGVCLVFILILYFVLNNFKWGRNPDVNGRLDNYNLIYINIDALRADHLGCYGYPRNTSPFIDSLAEKGILFEKALSNSSYTRESVAVLYSGRLPSCSGSVGWRAKPSKRVNNIGTIFKDAGYKTALFSNSAHFSYEDFQIGFNVTGNYSRKGGNAKRAHFVTSKAIGFIEKNLNQKFMMLIHYLDPHGPYDPPEKFYKRFQTKIYPNPIKLYGKVRKTCHELIKSGFGPGDPRFEDMIVRYDGEIASVDNSVRVLFNRLKELNILKKTFVIISADHGEEFLDHNYVEHAWTLYNESLHIPLIFWAPDIISPKRFPTRVSTVDVLPTILEMMGIPHQRKDFDGSSLFSYEGKGACFTPPAKPIICELFVQHRGLIRTIIVDDWKYIAAQKWLRPSQRPKALVNIGLFEADKNQHLDIWGPVVHEELYNLSADPGEKHNLMNEEKMNQFRRMMEDYKLYCQEYGLKGGTTLHKRKKLTKKEKERLKSLGYL
jgi:arylsulfatase A-like enzyme